MESLAFEIAALRTELGALTQGLLVQQSFLRVMDEKLNKLLEAAAPADDGDPLTDLLRDMMAELQAISGRQTEMFTFLRETRHH